MFLIDGYNLLHVVARGKATAEARERLVSLIEGYCRSGGYRACIVFDATRGMRRHEERGPVEVRNVAEGRKADDEILALIEVTKDRTAYTVVSNDRAIVQAAEKKRIAVVPCEEFARLLARPPDSPEKSDAPSSGEVDYWLREFGLNDDAK